jgi:hypothetical protein
VAGTAVFAAQPASRAWRPGAAAAAPRGGSLRAPAMRTLVLVLLASGVVFGAVEVAVVAARRRARQRAPRAARCSALWGAGSLVGGDRRRAQGGGARTGAGLALVLAASPRAPRPRGGRRQRRGARGGPRARRGDHRTDLRERLRHGRPRGARRDGHRGVRLAEHRRSPSAPRPARRAPARSPTPPARPRPSYTPAPHGAAAALIAALARASL